MLVCKWLIQKTFMNSNVEGCFMKEPIHNLIRSFRTLRLTTTKELDQVWYNVAVDRKITLDPLRNRQASRSRIPHYTSLSAQQSAPLPL